MADGWLREGISRTAGRITMHQNSYLGLSKEKWQGFICLVFTLSLFIMFHKVLMLQHHLTPRDHCSSQSTWGMVGSEQKGCWRFRSPHCHGFHRGQAPSWSFFPKEGAGIQVSGDEVTERSKKYRVTSLSQADLRCVNCNQKLLYSPDGGDQNS